MSLSVKTSKAGNITALMVALLTACVAFQLNASMLSPALVTMGEELNASQAAIGLSQTWFFTAAAVFSLFLPRLSDIIGRKKVLVGMMILMGVGSIISAMAPDITWLFVGRIIQGVSGPTVPLCLIMLRSAVKDPKKYGALMGLITAVNGGIAGIDSFVGGYFAEQPEGIPPIGLYDRVLEEVERPLIQLTLTATRGNQVRAAEILGLNRNTLRKKIQDLGVEMSRGRR